MYDLFQKLEGNVRLIARIDPSLSIGAPFQFFRNTCAIHLATEIKTGNIRR